MANTTLTPNMSLVVPTVATDPGPDWANNLNASLSILDQHNHSPGSGVQISQSGITLFPSGASLDSLTFANSNAYNLRSVRFQAQSAALALGTDIGCIYVSGVDLYYNDGAANQIRITSGGSVAGSSGTITGLPSGTASASYSAGTFIFQSATSTAANIDGGSFIFRNSTASSKGLTLQPPNAMAANYSLTLPTVPGSTSFVTLDASGNISGSIGTANGLTGSNIVSSVNLTGKTVQESSLNVVVSQTNAGTNSLAIIRGSVVANAFSSGEGFTVTHSGTGSYLLTWAGSGFLDAPVVTIGNLDVATTHFIRITATTTASASISIVNSGGSAIDGDFSFIAIGQRN